MTPRISIVIVTDGAEGPLRSTLKSVLSQQGVEREVLVVSRSAGDVRTPLRECRPDDVTWIDRPGAHAVAALNAGLSLCRGDVVAWLVAGDVYYRDALRSVGEIFDRNPEADVVYGDAVAFDELGEVLGGYRVKPWRRVRLRRRCCLCQPAVFVRRPSMERTGRLDERLRHWSDYDFWLRLDADGAQFQWTPQLLAGCRVPPLDRDGFLAGPFPRERSLEAAEELNDLYQRRYGKVPARWLVHAGRVAAYEQALGRAGLLTVLRHVRCAARRWNSASGPSVLMRSFVPVKGALSEWRKRRRAHLERPNPDEGLPGCAVRVLRTGLRYVKRRIFKLRHYEPRQLTLPAAYARTSPPPAAPLISIVTPNLDQGRFLEATLQSVLDQDYPRLEYIVQDGGSKDGSIEVIRRYSGRLARWTSEPDRGQAHAINLGMRHATGEIMAYLNSDDVLLPGALAYVARHFAENPQIDVVYGHRVLIDENGRDIGRWVLPAHDDAVLSFVDYVPQETMFWRRGLWEKVGGRLDEEFHFAMDWDLILRFRDAGGRFRRLPRFLGAFRVSNDQKTSALIDTVGRRDMEILRKRVLGHVPTNREIRAATGSYVRRHWLTDKLYLAGVLRH